MKICNISVGLTFEHFGLDLRDICQNATNVILNRQPPFLKITKRPPQHCEKCNSWTGLLFASGKAIVTGIRLENDIIDAITWFTRQLRSAYAVVVENFDYYIKSITAKGNFNRLLPVNKIYRVLPVQYLSYEPELQPYVIYRENGVVCTIFPSTGSVMLFGKSVSAINEIWTNLNTLL